MVASRADVLIRAVVVINVRAIMVVSRAAVLDEATVVLVIRAVVLERPSVL